MNLTTLMQLNTIEKATIKSEIEKSLSVLFQQIPDSIALEKEIMKKVEMSTLRGVITSKGINTLIENLCVRQDYILKRMGMDANFKNFFNRNTYIEILTTRSGETKEVERIDYTKVVNEKALNEFIEITFRNTCWQIDVLKNKIEETKTTYKIKGSYYSDIFNRADYSKIDSVLRDILNLKGYEGYTIKITDKNIEVDGSVLCTYKVQKNGTLIFNKL